ncbi:MAG: hypothetical protein UU47_C0003G0047 [candidate division TM6 bacterium GW2011_GWE2_41_16]|nr:MAG: hypothetical protein UU47_C0003G0047 [candidate division TM6 bacterium GW2011_GWE2_41_16]
MNFCFLVFVLACSQNIFSVDLVVNNHTRECQIVAFQNATHDEVVTPPVFTFTAGNTRQVYPVEHINELNPHSSIVALVVPQGLREILIDIFGDETRVSFISEAGDAILNQRYAIRR